MSEKNEKFDKLLSSFPDDLQFTFNPNRNILKHNKECYDSIHENTEKWYGKDPSKMICTIENCSCQCHKEEGVIPR